jgi:dihydroflavonol-4-reductase
VRVRESTDEHRLRHRRPTLYAIAEATAKEVRPPRPADNPARDQLGYDPMSLDAGLRLLIPWLRGLGRL